MTDVHRQIRSSAKFLLGVLVGLVLGWIVAEAGVAAQYGNVATPRQYPVTGGMCYTLGTSAISCIPVRY